MVSPEVTTFTHTPAASETTSSTALPRQNETGFFIPEENSHKLVITKEDLLAMKSTHPYIAGWVHDYDDIEKNYSDKTTDESEDWDIRSEQLYQDSAAKSSEDNTIPMSGRIDLEAVEDATTLEDALKAYDENYSLKAIKAGEQSPQLCAEMLLRINDKFEDDMTPEQRHAVALETIAVGCAIGRLAELPPEESPDRTTLKGLIDMVEIMDLAQKHAPEEIPVLEEGILNVAEKIDSRTSDAIPEPVSGPIRKALEQFNDLPEDEKMEIAFTDIVTRIAHDELNIAESKVEQRLDSSEELYASMSDSSPKPARDIESVLDATGIYSVKHRQSQDTNADSPNTAVAV